MTRFSRCSKSPRNRVPARSAPHVEGVDAGVPEPVGNLVLIDPQGEALGDGRLSDPRVSHVDRIVLAASAEDVDGSLELVSTADERVDLSLGGSPDEVTREGLKRVLPGLGAPRLVDVYFLGLLAV